MHSKKNFVEKRNHKRFEVKEGAFVEFYKPRLFNLGRPRLVKYAQIINISEGGLGFVYVDRKMWLLDSQELTISDYNNEIKIDKVPFKILRDFPQSKLIGSKSLRKCGVKFGELTSDQKSKLYSFIHATTASKHTMDRRFGKDRRQIDAPHHDVSNKRSSIERRGNKGRRRYDIF